MHRHVGFVGTLGIFISLAIAAVAAGADQERPVFYEGQVIEDHQHRSEIDMKVRKRTAGEQDRNLWVLFDGIFVQECDDGSRELAGGFIKLRFETARRFRGSVEEVDDFSNYSKFRVKGRLRSGGEADGWLWNLADRKDPPDEGHPDLPDCKTQGRLRWKAERVNSDDADFPRAGRHASDGRHSRSRLDEAQ